MFLIIWMGLFPGFFILTWWSVRRHRRCRFLRLLSVLMRREMPLEEALSGLTGQTGARDDERLARILADQLGQGHALIPALRQMSLIDSFQSAALMVAHRYGATPAMLSAFARENEISTRRVSAALVFTLYPIIVGSMLLSVTFLLSFFALPKFEAMFHEMEVWSADFSYWLWGQACVALMLVLGLVGVLLQTQRLGAYLCWRVPVLGTHFQMEAQAKLARALGKMLEAGATTEDAVQQCVYHLEGAARRLGLEKVKAKLRVGTPPLEAFRTSWRWRSEFLWTWVAIENGAPPGPALENVAMVFDAKAHSRRRLFNGVFLPLAVIAAGTGVGIIAFALFNSLYQVVEKSISL